jgi:hypothetical protein
LAGKVSDVYRILQNTLELSNATIAWLRDSSRDALLDPVSWLGDGAPSIKSTDCHIETEVGMLVYVGECVFGDDSEGAKRGYIDIPDPGRTRRLVNVCAALGFDWERWLVTGCIQALPFHGVASRTPLNTEWMGQWVKAQHEVNLQRYRRRRGLPVEPNLSHEERVRETLLVEDLRVVLGFRWDQIAAIYSQYSLLPLDIAMILEGNLGDLIPYIPEASKHVDNWRQRLVRSPLMAGPETVCLRLGIDWKHWFPAHDLRSLLQVGGRHLPLDENAVRQWISFVSQHIGGPEELGPRTPALDALLRLGGPLVDVMSEL